MYLALHPQWHACGRHLRPSRAEAAPIADAAARDRVTHRAFLAELLSTGLDARTERCRLRRRKEARFPRVKTLDTIDVTATPVEPATIAALAAGGWINRGEPVVLLGDPAPARPIAHHAGNGRDRQGRSVWYVTAAGLVNEPSRPPTTAP